MHPSALVRVSCLTTILDSRSLECENTYSSGPHRPNLLAFFWASVSQPPHLLGLPRQKKKGPYHLSAKNGPNRTLSEQVPSYLRLSAGLALGFFCCCCAVLRVWEASGPHRPIFCVLLASLDLPCAPRHRPSRESITCHQSMNSLPNR